MYQSFYIDLHQKPQLHIALVQRGNSACPYKGDAEDGYVTDLMVKALKWFGYTRLIVKSDNEPALNRLVKSAIDKAKLEMPELRQIAEEHPTAYDSKANGAAEFVDDVSGQGLKKEMAIKARLLEMRFFRQMKL